MLKSMRFSFRCSFQFESHFQNEEKAPIIEYFLKEILRKLSSKWLKRSARLIHQRKILSIFKNCQYNDVALKRLTLWMRWRKKKEHDRVTIQLIHFCDIYVVVPIYIKFGYNNTRDVHLLSISYNFLCTSHSLWGINYYQRTLVRIAYRLSRAHSWNGTLHEDFGTFCR